MAKNRTPGEPFEDQKLGTLSSSKARGRLFVFSGSVVFFGAVPLSFITWLLYGLARQDLLPWPVVGGFAAVSAVLWVVGLPLWLLAIRSSKKQDLTTSVVRKIASERDWEEHQRVPEWESGWTLAPFSQLKNVIVSPGASARKGGVRYGVAYLEGDLAVAGSEVKAIQTRLAVAELGIALPTTVIVAERFVDAVAKLLGGTDLDVESVDFNRRWRVKTLDAAGSHGLLTPRVIEYLIEERAPGLAIQFDGTRIVIWDDAKSDRIDLEERLELLEGLVERLPGFLKPTD